MSSGLFAGRYSIERVLGQGATATVHLARDTQRGIAVAIKILRPELAQSKATDRFLKEIRRTAQLQHAHILRVLDSGEHDGRPYFVLPYMEGGTLRTKLKRNSQLSFEETISILRTVAEALDYAHKKGLVHRDVKPENILFTGGQACLGDFGIARALETVYGITEGSSSSNTVRGTYAYMSPEQAAGGQNLDGRSDIYSLACVAYEMITGMQAFIGPTPEAVVAQRFVYTPREVRVYRPSAPAAVDTALAKAFAMAPADRYKTATEFVTALEKAMSDELAGATVRRETPAGLPPRMRRVISIGAIAALVVVMTAVTVFAWKARKDQQLRTLASLDTTRVLVLPVSGDSSLPLSQIHQLLYDGFARWQGIHAIAVREAGVTLPAQPSEVAFQASAGRYIEAKANRVGDEIRLSASLMDAPSRTRLFEFVMRVPPSTVLADSILWRFTDTLLIRRLDIGDGPAGTKNLTALQLFASGLTALRTWNLQAADSLMITAAGLDRSFGRASLWAAQVRLWREWPADRWRILAEKALTDSSLSQRERLLGKALVHLANREFQLACDDYHRLRQRDVRDFSAWYGLGDCHRKDTLVVRDARSRSGWRFRSSYGAAVRAYVRAFELSPYVHRAFQPRGYNRLQSLLHTSGRALRLGQSSAPVPRDFFAYPEWAGDTLAFTPYPAEVVEAGLARFDAASLATAIARQRELFAKIAHDWSTVLPTSASAKEAVALSLDMLGDSTAIDTLFAARRLAKDPQYQLELAVEEALLRFEFAHESVAALEGLRRLADSLVVNVKDSSREASVLALIVALRGRCSMSSRFRSPNDHFVRAKSSQHVKDLASDLTLRVAMNCEPNYLRQADAIVQAAGRDRHGVSARELMDEEYALLSQALPLVTPFDTARLLRFKDTPDYLWRAQRALVARNAAEARSILERLGQRRGPIRAREVTPDALLAEARIWVALGDSARARSWLDPVLNRVGWLDLLLDAPVNAAALIQCMALRAELATPDEPHVRRKWNTMVRSLWHDADEGPRQVAERLATRHDSP